MSIHSLYLVLGTLRHGFVQRDTFERPAMYHSKELSLALKSIYLFIMFTSDVLRGLTLLAYWLFYHVVLHNIHIG